MLRPWLWEACWGSGLGPGVPAGEGVWRVWMVLEGLEGFGGCLEGLEGFGGFGGLGGFWRVFGGFGGFWRVWRVLERLERLRAGKRQLCKPIESHCCGLGPGVPVGEVALALGCLLGKVFGILEGFGAFAGWQTAALKAHRKSLLWPWPWGACWGSCLR